MFSPPRVVGESDATKVGALITFLVAVAACTPRPPALPEAPRQASSTAQANLLLFPEANAESLLGRAVQVTKDGGWTMADVRAPGCEVSAKREKASFHSARQVDAHSMTSLAGGYAKFVSLEATFGQTSTAEVDVNNTEILRADLRGACGEYVVDTVFVGHGKRNIKAQAAFAAKSDVHVGVVSAAPAVDTGQSIVDAVDWSEDQAYGFSFRKLEKSEPLSIHAELPTTVSEGDPVTIRFTSERPAWLVVYYLSDGKADVLWPSNEESEPHVVPGSIATLPSARERAQGFEIRATVAKPGTPSRETLVIYGFSEKTDFDAMKPAPGAESADGAAYAAELTKRLQGIPLSRWSRAVVGYVIEPKGR